MKNRENLTELTEAELDEKFRHYKEELFNLRFQVVTGQLTNTARIAMVKKNIARVQTLINKTRRDKIHQMLKEEYDSVLKEKSVESKSLPLNEKIVFLKTKLSGKALQVQREIRAQVDGKVCELFKAIRGKISDKLKTFKGKDGGKEEAEWRASSRRLANPKVASRKKFLDKLASLGLNEASEIKALRETKQAKLAELQRIRTLQRELNSGHLPF